MHWLFMHGNYEGAFINDIAKESKIFDFKPEVGNPFRFAGHIGKKLGLRGPIRLKVIAN